MEETARLHFSIPAMLGWAAAGIPLAEVYFLNSIKPIPRGSGDVFLMCLGGCGIGVLIAVFAFWQMGGRRQAPRLIIMVGALLALLVNTMGGLASAFFWALSGLPGP